MKLRIAIIGLAIGTLLGALTGCAGTAMRLEYGPRDGKTLAFELKLPDKYAK